MTPGAVYQTFDAWNEARLALKAEWQRTGRKPRRVEASPSSPAVAVLADWRARKARQAAS